MNLSANSSSPAERYFYLERVEDESGVSGTGIVAEGFEFWDGTCALRWLKGVRCVAYYNSIAELEHIHGHGGKTYIRRLEE